jgi:hypothetical protein
MYQMRELFEDAVLVYRQEADSVLTVVGVTAVLSLILLLLSAMSMTFALTAVPLFVLMYLATYALCLQWAGSTSTSRTFGYGTKPWLEVLARGPSILYAAGPACVLAVLVAGSAVIAGHEGFWYLSIADGLLGLAAGLQWLIRHAYDEPLVVVFDVGARDAIDAGSRLTESDPEWTIRVLAWLFAPLIVVGAICVGLGMLLAPLAAAAVFVLALTAWLPFAALVLAGACQRLLDDQGAVQRLTTAGVALP